MFDEKTGMGTLLSVTIPNTRAGGSTRARRTRVCPHGTQTLIAATDVRTGKLLGQVGRRTGAELVKPMDTLAERYPSGDVYVIWDNLNIHFDGREKR